MSTDITGNLTADPKLSFTESGVARCKLTIAYTPKRFDRQTQSRVEGTTLYLEVTLWRDFALNVAASVQKGTRVVATGTLEQENFQTADGRPGSKVVLKVDSFGPDLRYAQATVIKPESTAASVSAPVVEIPPVDEPLAVQSERQLFADPLPPMPQVPPVLPDPPDPLQEQERVYDWPVAPVGQQ